MGADSPSGSLSRLWGNLEGISANICLRGRYCIASAKCAVVISSSPAKFAMVRANFNTR